MGEMHPDGSESRRELMAKAVGIAEEILAGTVGPNDGCARIGAINDELSWPTELAGFGQLAHEQHGHEDFGMTAENCVPDILEEAKKLVCWSRRRSETG